MSDDTETDTAELDEDLAILANMTPEQAKLFSTSFTEGTLITPDRLMVDLRLLRDFDVGAILAMSQRDGGRELLKKNYQNIQKALPKYVSRRFADPGHYFEECGYTTDQIEEALRDETLADSIFHASPATRFHRVLNTQILFNLNHSEVVGKKSPITITINTYPLLLNKETKDKIGLFISGYFKTRVKIVCQDYASLKWKDLSDIEEFYLYYLKKFMDSEDVRQAASDFKLKSVRIFAAPLGHRFDPEMTPAKMAKEFVLIDSHLGILLEQFKHFDIRSIAPIDGDDKQENIKKEKTEKETK